MLQVDSGYKAQGQRTDTKVSENLILEKRVPYNKKTSMLVNSIDKWEHQGMTNSGLGTLRNHNNQGFPN